MPKFDRKKFFQGFRDKIDSTIEPEQVDGLNFLLDKMEVDPFWKDIRHIAYALATTYHETAGSFQPVTEGYYLAKTDPPDYAGNTARVKRFQKTLRYYPYHGRGYVQLTWKTNYEKAGKILNMDLVNKPELALDREGAYLTMTYGMHQGWFAGDKTGKRHTLSRHISDTGKDYKEARRIINGTDKAALISGYANAFEQILRDSKTNSAAVKPATGPNGQEPTDLHDKGNDLSEGAAADITERPTQNIENIENAKIESPKIPPQTDPVTVTSERVSVFAKIGAAFTAITALGINLGNVSTTKLNELTPQQIVWLVGACLLIAAALWFYDRAAKRAHEKTLAKMKTAADPAQNTVTLKG